jgi:hypothetical protein
VSDTGAKVKKTSALLLGTACVTLLSFFCVAVNREAAEIPTGKNY